MEVLGHNVTGSFNSSGTEHQSSNSGQRETEEHLQLCMLTWRLKLWQQRTKSDLEGKESSKCITVRFIE